MISLPLWAAFVIGFGSPVLAFVGVFVAQLLQRRAATELETRSKREETMRNLRWAAELAVGDDERLSELGVAELQALLDSDLLEEEQKTFVEAALDTVYSGPRGTLEELGDNGEAVEIDPSDKTASSEEGPELGSTPYGDEGESDG